MKFTKVLVLLLVLGLIAAACASDADDTTTTAAPATTAATTTTTEAATTTTEEPMAAVGSAENPITVVFVPSVSAEEIVAGGELLDDTLTSTTGLEFEVSVGSSYAATIEEMCAAPDSTIGFIPATGYVLASDLCNVEITLKGIRFGDSVYYTQFIVGRDSGLNSVEDLAGKKWAYPDATSTSGLRCSHRPIRESRNRGWRFIRSRRPLRHGSRRVQRRGRLRYDVLQSSH